MTLINPGLMTLINDTRYTEGQAAGRGAVARYYRGEGIKP